MIGMWAKRYIEIGRKEGNTKARLWASQFIPEDAKVLVKSAVENLLGIKR